MDEEGDLEDVAIDVSLDRLDVVEKSDCPGRTMPPGLKLEPWSSSESAVLGLLVLIVVRPLPLFVSLRISLWGSLPLLLLSFEREFLLWSPSLPLARVSSKTLRVTFESCRSPVLEEGILD